VVYSNLVSAQTGGERVATNIEVTAQFPDNPFGCKFWLNTPLLLSSSHHHFDRFV
jgi:hypothetical protein